MLKLIIWTELGTMMPMRQTEIMAGDDDDDTTFDDSILVIIIII